MVVYSKVTTERTDGRTTRTLGGVAGRVRGECFPLDAKRKRQGSTARNVSGARTHKKNGRQNPRASYFTVCQAVRGFYNITDKHLAKKNCAHQNGSAAASSAAVTSPAPPPLQPADSNNSSIATASISYNCYYKSSKLSSNATNARATDVFRFQPDLARTPQELRANSSCAVPIAPTTTKRV